jgi:glycosyltransferase involved in cell wall biosynthesis
MCDDIRIWSRGIDSALFHPSKRDDAWRAAHGIAPGDVAIAFVGRLVLEKGLDLFAAAIDLLKARGVAHKVVVIGDGPERAWFEGRLPGAIFTGFLGDAALAKAYASSDIFFNPSTTETFGNVTLEAMAAGVPPVCARATGSMSLVEHGTSGLLADGAVDEYADYLAYLVGNAQMRAAFAAAGRARALSYNWDNILQGVLMNYCDVLSAQTANSTVSRGGLSPAAAH